MNVQNTEQREVQRASQPEQPTEQLNAGLSINPPHLQDLQEIVSREGVVHTVKNDAWIANSFDRAVIEDQFKYRRGGADYRELNVDEQQLLKICRTQLDSLEMGEGILGTVHAARVKTVDNGSDIVYVLADMRDTSGHYQELSHDLAGYSRLTSAGVSPVYIEMYREIEDLPIISEALLNGTATLVNSFNYRMLYSPSALAAQFLALENSDYVKDVLSEEHDTGSYVLYQALRTAATKLDAGSEAVDLSGRISFCTVKSNSATDRMLRVEFTDIDQAVEVRAQLKTHLPSLSRAILAEGQAPATYSESLREALGVLFFSAK